MKKQTVRIIVMVLCLVMLAGIAACGGGGNPSPSGNAPETGNNSPSPGGNSNNQGNASTSPNDSSSPDSERIELVFSLWGDPAEQEVTQEALDVYNNLQDKVYVKALQIGRDEYNEKLQTMAMSGNMPDCGMVAEDTVIGWARDGLLMPIDIFEGQANKPLDYITFKDGGKTIAYSGANEVLALWYNRAMFDAAGLPYPPATLDKAWSWDKFIEVAKKLTFDSNGNHPGDDGFDKNSIVQYGCYVNQYTWQLEVWALSNGGRFFSPDGKSIAMDDAAVEALQKVFDLHLVENVAPFIDGTVDAGFGLSLGAGNVAMCTEGQWATGFAGLEDFADLDFGVAVLPYMKQKANICTGGPVGMFATTQYPDEVAKFIRWYTDEDENFAVIEAGWWMPTKMNWYTDEALLKRWIDDVAVRQPLTHVEYRTAIVDVALDFNVTKSTGWYYTPNTFEILVGVLQPALVEAINGSKTAKDVIEANRAAMQAALG